MITQEETVAYLDYFSENLEKLCGYANDKAIVTSDDICSAFDLDVRGKGYPVREASRLANIFRWPRTRFVDHDDWYECILCQCIVPKMELIPNYCPWCGAQAMGA